MRSSLNFLYFNKLTFTERGPTFQIKIGMGSNSHGDWESCRIFYCVIHRGKWKWHEYSHIYRSSQTAHTWHEYKIKIIVTISCNKLLQWFNSVWVMHLDFFPQGHDAALDKVIRVQESLARQCLCHDKQTECHQYPTADFVEGCVE